MVNYSDLADRAFNDDGTFNDSFIMERVLVVQEQLEATTNQLLQVVNIVTKLEARISALGVP